MKNYSVACIWFGYSDSETVASYCYTFGVIANSKEEAIGIGHNCAQKYEKSHPEVIRYKLRRDVIVGDFFNKESIENWKI